MNPIEPFIVADAQDFQNYSKLRARTVKESDCFNDAPMALQLYPGQNYSFTGYNYDDTSKYTYPDNIDQRILSQTARGLPLDQQIPNIPVGYNANIK
jgi:hypothetical protein